MGNEGSTVDLALAGRLARACDCAYAVGTPGGPPSSPSYGGVGFTAAPQGFLRDAIDAALVGTSADGVILAFRGTLPLSVASLGAFLDSLHDWLDDAEAAEVATHLPPAGSFRDLLARFDSRVGKVSQRDYVSVGTLAFIDWDGRIVAGDAVSEATRRDHILELVLRGKLGQLLADHSLSGAYLPAVCAAAA